MFFFLFSNILILTFLGILCVNSSIPIIGSLICMGICIFSKQSKRNWIHLGIISSILLISVALLYYGYIEKYDVPYYIGGSDDKDFENFAQICVENGYYTPIQVYKHFYWYVAKGYVWIVSLIMRLSVIFGEYHTMLPRIANIYCLLIVGMILQKYCLIKMKFNENQSRRVLYFMTVFPNAIYICANLFRDVWVLLGIVSVFYIVDTELYKKKPLKWTLIGTVLTLITFFVRTQSILIILLEILIIYFLKHRNLNKKTVSIYIICIGIGLILLPYVAKEVFEYTSYYNNYLVEQQQGLSQLIFNKPLIPFGIILRFGYGLLSPFPNGIINIFHMFKDIDNFFNVIIAGGVVIQIILLPFLLKSLKKIKTYNTIYFIIFLTVIISTYTFRHFLLTYPFLWLSIWDEFYNTNITTRKTVILSTIFIMIIAGGMYLVLTI